MTSRTLFLVGACLLLACSGSGGTDGTAAAGDAGTLPDGVDAGGGNAGETDTADACTPQCGDGRECGDDGCGGSCGECPGVQSCTAAGLCEDPECEPACDGKACGPDGCGSTCGECTAPAKCTAAGACEAPCQPFCEGKECGPNGCGGFCGQCTAGKTCSALGQCACTPDCFGKDCGPDGCGGSCGQCAPGVSCTPDGECPGGGGESCVGVCGGGSESCYCDATCFEYGDCCPDVCEACGSQFPDYCCTPSCAGKACGSDGCGGSCGACLAGTKCSAGGECEPCSANCTGKECGDDGCNGTCGECGDGFFCDKSFTCVEGAGIVCGTDSDTTPDGFCPGATPDGCYCMGCNGDGTCTLDDDCVCPECASDDWCADPGSCQDDGTCDPFNEGCVCPDCAGHPECYCEPNCDGKECGYDGCYGTCGECAAGFLCDQDGACLAPEDVAGNTCTAPFVIDSTPAVLTGDTSKATAVYSVAPASCLAEGFGKLAKDQVYELTPGEDAVYTLKLTTTSYWAAGMYVTSDCPDATAGTAQVVCTKGAASATSLAVSLEGGVTYYVIVDGSSSTAGPYQLSVSAPCVPSCDGKECGSDGCGAACGECGEGEICTFDGVCLPPNEVPGNTCDLPLPIDELPFEASNDTSMATPYFAVGPGSCIPATGNGAPEQIYRLDVEADAVYTVEAVPKGAFAPVVYVTTGCPSIPEGVLGMDLSCVAGKSSPGPLSFEAKGGKTYYLFVDGSSSSQKGAYTLKVSEPCYPSCDGKECGSNGCTGTCGKCAGGLFCDAGGQCVPPEELAGNTCAAPLLIDEIPFAAQGDTTQATGLYSVAAGSCLPGATGQGNELVYELTPDEGGTYSFVLAKPPGSSWSHVMYLTSACPEVPAGVTGLPLSCLEGTTSAALYAELEAGETVWLFVDGASTSVFGIKEGPYALTVDLCTPDCDGVECGSDGCGGECGPCPSGLYCDEDDGACVDVPPESSCAGICGESPGECWCDDACFEYGDCCEDVCEHCADYYPYECSSWM